MSSTRPDAIPEPQNNRQFPIGDIDIESAMKAQVPLEALQEGDRNDRFNAHRRLLGMELRAWLATDIHDAYGHILSVTQGWAMEQQRSEAWAHEVRRIGAGTILAFNRRTHLIPQQFDDFSDDMRLLRDRPSAEFVNFYAHETWATMKASHPNLHSVLYPLIDSTLETYTGFVDPHRDRGAVFASAALPYQLASATRLLGYYRQYDDERIGREIEDWRV